MSSNAYCNLCESAEYYLYDDHCYKIPSQIKNCKIHEEFYNNEVSCLSFEENEKNYYYNINIKFLNFTIFIILILL